jgi:hypothetical protein
VLPDLLAELDSMSSRERLLALVQVCVCVCVSLVDTLSAQFGVSAGACTANLGTAAHAAGHSHHEPTPSSRSKLCLLLENPAVLCAVRVHCCSQGILAANIFDWGAKACVELYTNGTILDIFAEARVGTLLVTGMHVASVWVGLCLAAPC